MVDILHPSSELFSNRFVRSGYENVERTDLQLDPLDEYSLSGVVSEQTPTGLVPVEGALVTGSFGNPVTTDKSGFFSIPGGIYESDDYTYSFSVSKEGYQAYTRNLTITDDTQLDIQLVRR